MFNAALLVRYSHDPLSGTPSICDMDDDRNANTPPASATRGATCGMVCMAPSTLACMTASKSCCVGGVVALGRRMTPATYQAVSIFSPSSCQASPLTLAGWATSMVSTSAPRACTRSRPASSRTVAITRRPASVYWRTSSNPMPRDAPMMRMDFIFKIFQGSTA